jgi:predicted MFS family arabinose efflux permease
MKHTADFLPAPANQSRVLFWLSASAFASNANVRVTDALLPAIAVDFGVTPSNAAIIVSAYAVSYGVFQLIFGPIGDRLGKTRVAVLATLAAGIVCLAGAFASSLLSLTLLRGLLGICGAGIIPVAVAYIGDTVAFERRQPVLAYFQMGTMFGLIFGQAAGGILAEQLGWRATFMLLSAILIVTAAALHFETRAEARNEPRARISLGASFRQMFGLLRQSRVRTILAASFAEGAFAVGILSFIGVHLRERFGASFDEIGLLLAFYGIGGLTYALLSSVMLRRLHERGLLTFGGLLHGLSFLSAAVAPNALLFAPLLFSMGFAFMMVHNTIQTHGTQMAPQARGAGMSLYASCFLFGQTLGVTVTSVIYAHWGASPAFLIAAAGLVGLCFGFRSWIIRHQGA